MWLTLITALVGIISTLTAWYFNPKRILYSQLDAVYKELEECYVKRDQALEKNDSDSLAIVTDDIIKLLTRKNVLLQRL